MKNKLIFLSISVLIALIQIYLISVQPINATIMPYDDALMIDEANNIIQGKWLGEYNCLTLVKGIFFPLFLAMSNILHIPFLIMQDIFYILACGLIIFIFRKKIKGKVTKIIIFTSLIFCPIIYSSQMCRVYRDGVYMSLILYLIAFSFGLFLNRKKSVKKLIKYYVAIGIVITCIYLCREEFIWIIPYLLVGFIIVLVNILKDKEEKEKRKKCICFIIPIIVIIIVTTVIKTINYKYYGVFELNQYWSKEFKEAYGALTRINPEKKIKKVPVTKDMLEKAYKLSPKFAELKSYFEREIEEWRKAGDGPKGEIQGGWFHWALMRAVEENGYYENAKKANEYYRQIANEINRACDEGKVDCMPHKRVSNVIRFNFEDIIKSAKKTIEVTRYQYKFQLVKSKLGRNMNDFIENEDITKIENVTLSKIFTDYSYESSESKFKIGILEKIELIYKKINPYLFLESIIISIVSLIIVIIKKQNKAEEIIILTGLVGIYICRVFIISFTSVTMYTNAVNTLYLAPTYPIQIMFSMFANIFFINVIKEVKKSVKQEIKENEKKDTLINKTTKELTILIPALNEENTIGICVKKAKTIIQQSNLDAEILVINNNSIDKTEEIAKKNGVRVEKEMKKGYGMALQQGIKQAKGKYIIMADADDSYNLLEIIPFYEKLKQGYDLVIGNRYKGKMEKGAMKLSHKYIGTPLISFIGRKKYKIPVHDFNCGFRGFNTEKMLKINCTSQGMEYATEMIIKSQKANLKITEIPINFYKDKRKNKSHLNTIRDGIRHIRLLLSNIT